MDREILFRGKQTDNGEWVEGYYTKQCDCCGAVHMILHCAQDPDDDNRAYYINPETVGQYTGLTDKNGKKIFEGDIISFFNGEDNTNYEIGWYKNQYIVSNNDDGNDTLDDFVCEKSIVIGNIYDNPELLEVS